VTDKQEVTLLETPRQVDQVPALDLLVSDLRRARAASFRTERRRPSGILCGQFLILALAYRRGQRPSPRTLSRFFTLASRDQAIPGGAA
jgi:hypothetical protein